jgi:hypothetical protein
VRSRTLGLALGGVFLAAYAILLLRHNSFSVGGSDSSGYLNTARRMVEGRLVERPRTLDRLGLPDQAVQLVTPLGFVPGPRGTMAPYYPAGFPAHMAVAAQLFGWNLGPFLVSPLAAALCLPLFYLVARELALSPIWAAAGTALFAAWPVLIGQAIQPMSDATATFWSLASVLCAVKARRRALWALPSGAALGIAVLVRPTNLLLAVPLAFALPIAPAALALFAIGGIPFAALLAAFNLHCYGNALNSGYRQSRLFDAIALANFPPRLRHYGSWLFRSLTPLVPLAWLGLPFDRNVRWRDRALLLSWFGSFFLFYCLYEPYDSFGFVRFLLPAAPGLFLGALLTARDISARLPALPALRKVLAALLFTAVIFAEVRTLRMLGILGIGEGESVYPQICGWAAQTVPSGAVVLSMQASGALEHYTDLSYARWDWLTPEKFAELRARIRSRGGRVYALLFPFEWEQIPQHASGNWRKVGELRQVGLWELED